MEDVEQVAITGVVVDPVAPNGESSTSRTGGPANDDNGDDGPATKKIKLDPQTNSIPNLDDLVADQFADAAPQDDPVVLLLPQEPQQQQHQGVLVKDPPIAPASLASSNNTVTPTESSSIVSQPKVTAAPEKGGDNDDEDEDDDDLFGDKDDDVKDPAVVNVNPSAEIEIAASPTEQHPVVATSTLIVAETGTQQPSTTDIDVVAQPLSSSPQKEPAPEMAVPRKSPNGNLPKVGAVTTHPAPSQRTPAAAATAPRAPVVPPSSKPKHYTKSGHNNNNNKTPGPVYGLPLGVHIPASIVRIRLLETEMSTPGSKLMDVLRSLPINLINDALSEYDDAVEIKGAPAIRNHGAYLYGVVKRYVNVHERSQQEGDMGLLPMGEEGLTPAVHIRLEQLVRSNFCTRQEMNEKVKSKIRMLSEKDALFALEELASVERHSIRNFGSYFMGILNRYMRGDHQSKIRPKPDQQPPPPQQYQSTSSSTQFGGTNHRFPPTHGNNARGDHRFNANAPNNNINNNNRRSSGVRNNDPMTMALNHQQQQPWQQQQQHQQQQPNNPMFNASPMSGGQPMGGMMMNVNHANNNNNMGGMMNPPQPNNTMMGGASMMGGNVNQPPMGTTSLPPGIPQQPNPNFPSNSNYGSSLSQQQQQSFSSYPPYGDGGGGMGGGMPAMYPSQQQPQQPHVGSYSQNPSQPQQLVSGGTYGQQMQQPPNSYGVTGPINSNVFGQPPLPNSSVYGQQQQQQPNTSVFGQQSNNSYGGPSNSFPTSGYAQQNNSSGVPTPYNMGGAPPANQKSSPYGPSFVTNPPGGGTHQPPSYPQQTGGGGWNSSQQQSAIDILGLADKAASAIQALGGSSMGSMGFPNTTVQQQQHPQQQQYPPSAQQQPPSSSYTPYSSRMGGQQPPPPQSGHMVQQQSQPYSQQQQPFAAPQGDFNSQGARRRTTAQLHELPLTVQYAVQNLVATGAVSGQLDEGILGMIVDLPEELALSTLQKFAIIDKSTMRNKTAYLAGVLRRELEKIHRR